LTPASGRRGKKEPAPDSSSAATTDSVSPSPSNSSGQTVAAHAKKEPRGPRGRRSSKTSLAEKTNVEASPEASKKVPASPAQPTILKKPAAAPQTQTPKGPAAARPGLPQGPKAQSIPTGPAASRSGASSPRPPTPTTPSPCRQAFLKHANPSQGITEALIEEALTAFGKIEKVEIDRKKGFAYVDFADNEGLRKAVAASPVKVAEGAVQVLERRDRPAGRPPPLAPMQMQRGGFRGRGRGRGVGRGGMGGGPSSPSVQAAAPAGVLAAPAVPAAAPTEPASSAAEG